MAWVKCIENLPEIDYVKKKTSIKVRIRIHGKIKRAWFRQVHQEDIVYGIFYNLNDGTIYKHITEWEYIK